VYNYLTTFLPSLPPTPIFLLTLFFFQRLKKIKRLSSRSATLREKSSRPSSMAEKEALASSLSEKDGEKDGEKDVATSVEPSADPSVIERVGEFQDVGVTTEKGPQNELKKIQTSEEGVEYPTGVRLGLITLALCLSVFLMALV
jgi:hypothetical protein